MNLRPASRVAAAVLVLSGAGLIGIALEERFVPVPYMPTPNDRPTIGFGSTDGVKMTDPPITVERGLIRLHKDVTDTERGLKECIGNVPLYQHEWDAYVSWAFNVGVSAACSSTLVKLLKERRYEDACNQLPRWNKQAGKELPGLTKRREKERRLCLYGER